MTVDEPAGSRAAAERCISPDVCKPRRVAVLLGADGTHLHRCLTGLQDAELVALRIGQDHPGDLALPNVNARSSQPDQSLHLGVLLVRTQVNMETVLPLLGFVYCQEQNPWQPVRLWLDLKHDRVVIDDHPSERLTPPAAKRNRVTGGDNDLLPLKTHGRTIADRAQRCPEFGQRRRRLVTSELLRNRQGPSWLHHANHTRRHATLLIVKPDTVLRWHRRLDQCTFSAAATGLTLLIKRCPTIQTSPIVASAVKPPATTVASGARKVTTTLNK